MVTLRLARSGSKKRPFFHLTVTDSRRARDGRFIERIGFYNPIARGKETRLRIDLERVDHWFSVGAQASARARKLIDEARRSASEEPAAESDVDGAPGAGVDAARGTEADAEASLAEPQASDPGTQ